jgi:hypothetical protein
MQQAEQAGQKIKQAMDSDGQPYNLFFYTSPYKRSRQTHDSVSSCFAADQLKGVQEEVQLREQDFGNFQVSCLHDAHDTKHLACINSVCQDATVSAHSNQGRACLMPLELLLAITRDNQTISETALVMSNWQRCVLRPTNK